MVLLTVKGIEADEVEMKKTIVARSFIVIIFALLLFSCELEKLNRADDEANADETVDEQSDIDEQADIDEQPDTDGAIDKIPGVFNLLTPGDFSIDVSVNPTMTWEASDGVETYTIKLTDNENDPNINNYTMKFDGLTETARDIKDLKNSTKYFWRVTAHNSAGYRQSKIFSFFTIKAGDSSFDLKTPVDKAQKVILSPTLTWNSSDRASSYSIIIADNPALNNPVVTVAKQKQVFYSFLNDLQPETTYFWRVTAHSVSGDTVCKSDFSFTTADPSVYYVKYDAVGTNTGLSWKNAFTDLQVALGVAEKGDEIWVAKGTYYPTADTDRSKSFQLIEGVAFYGGFAGTESSRDTRNPQTNETILSGNIGEEDIDLDNTYNVVKGANDAVIDGFKVAGGYANGSGTASSGGGILNENGNLMVANCVFADNYAGSGAGMNSNNSTATVVIDSVFENNSASSEGGGIGSYGSSIIISGCVFKKNTAMLKGGGIYLGENELDKYSELDIYYSTFNENTAENGASTKKLTSGGGGMFIQGSRTDIHNCAFNNNNAAPGGGICATGKDYPVVATVNVSDSIFNGNKAGTGDGGGIFGGNLTVINSIFYKNSARTGGGVNVQFSAESFIANSVFYKNSASMGGGISPTIGTAKGINLIAIGNTAETYSQIGKGPKVSFSNIEGGFGGNIDEDPLFVDPENGDFHLKKGSPSINSGSTFFSPRPETDLDGNPRIVEVIDMGAYEFQ